MVLCLFVKARPNAQLSYENEFYLHVNERKEEWKPNHTRRTNSELFHGYIGPQHFNIGIEAVVLVIPRENRPSKRLLLFAGQSVTRPRYNDRCDPGKRKTEGGRHHSCGWNRGPYCDTDQGPSHTSAPEGTEGQKPVPKPQRAVWGPGYKDCCEGPGKGACWNTVVCSAAAG